MRAILRLHLDIYYDDLMDLSGYPNCDTVVEAALFDQNLLKTGELKLEDLSADSVFNSSIVLVED